MLTIIYYDLRVRKEGFDIHLLARGVGSSTATSAENVAASSGLGGYEGQRAAFAPPAQGGGFAPPQAPSSSPPPSVRRRSPPGGRLQSAATRGLQRATR